MQTTQETRIVKEGKSFLDFKRESETSEFPHLFSKYIMSMGEIYYWPKGGFHVVTSVDLAKAVLTSPSYSADRGAFFISRMPNMDLSLIGDFFGVVRKMMVMSDGAEHDSRRKAAAQGFEDHVLNRFEARVKETITNLVTSIDTSKPFDFANDLAKKLPSTVLADLFSIPVKDRADFYVWSNTMTAFFGGASQYRNEDGIEVNAAAKALTTYFKELFVERKKNPGEDYVSLLLKMGEIFSLTEGELVAQAVMMLVAGQVTTTDQINNNMYLLALHPELQTSLRQDLSKVPNAIEEFKRFDPAVTFLFRVAKEDHYLGGQFVKAGETLFLSTHALNRDAKLNCPFELNIERKGANHFAYGHGPHYCLGAKLGRMQMKLLFEALLTTFQKMELNQDLATERDHYSLSFSGFKNLYLDLT
ncbi:MAG: cytochrome P450 [Bacteriovoracaceae bacterium]